MAARLTTVTAAGHIQFGAPESLAGFFFSCGLE
jgi:hypothetical protein